MFSALLRAVLNFVSGALSNYSCIVLYLKAREFVIHCVEHIELNTLSYMQKIYDFGF